MTPSNFLIRGLLAGLLAGFISFAVAYTVGEPQVEAAIAVEEAGSAAASAEGTADDGHSHSHAEEDADTVVSRDTQSTWGLATGILAVSTAIGGVIGLVSAFAVGRLGRMSPGQSTAVIALIGFVAVWLVPFLKYPATPPAVGNPDTIGDRTLTYFAMQAISLLAAIGVVLLARRLLGNLGTYRTLLVTGGTYLLIVIVAGLLLPTVNEIGDFPADTLWYFRRASLLTNAAMWGSLGLILAGLIGRLYAQESRAAARKDLAASL
ncbi:CbtA family protein [Aeromicrobium sp.]|uniref:CbtA family protein n=1 Tax=Aeromicrobium sp. TaxID=1871063 RepID=UPI0030C1B762